MTAGEASSEAALHVMALVGSAGGLDAVSTVLGQLPDDLDAAVVVLIHQHPDHENRLVDLLAGRTTLPVRAATHGQALRPGPLVVAPLMARARPRGPAGGPPPARPSPAPPAPRFGRSAPASRPPTAHPPTFS